MQKNYKLKTPKKLYRHKLNKKLWVLFITIFSLNGVYAADIKDLGILYHCPSIREIKYQANIFSAITNYNKLVVNWYAFHAYPNSPKVISFNQINIQSDCSKGQCAVVCIYNTDKSGILALEASKVFSKIIKGPNLEWHKNFCLADKTEFCNFYLTPYKKIK